MPLVDEDVLDRTLAAALAGGGQFAEVFAEDAGNATSRLDDGSLETVVSGRARGAGVRVIAGGRTSFAHTADLTERGLLAAARAAAAGAGGQASDDAAPARTSGEGWPEDPLAHSVTRPQAAQMLAAADDAARSVDGRIRQVAAVVGSAWRRTQVANSEDVRVESVRTRARVIVSVVAKGDTGLQRATRALAAGPGRPVFEAVDAAALGAEAAERAIEKLAARPAPSGRLPVVLGPGQGAVLFHEACGHGLEADAVGRGASVYAGRLGDAVASSLVTLVDDGSMPGEWGTVGVDDEGRPAQASVLIDRGVLVSYLWDWREACRTSGASSGNGRRQSYRHLPLVRMTNTYVLPGEDDPAEIVRQTARGIYVSALGGGSVNTATGDFVFGAREAYLIEDGSITAPLREVNLVGNGPDVLASVDAVGWDLAMGEAGATCGKDGQSAPVGIGQPTVRVPAMTVGGAAR